MVQEGGASSHISVKELVNVGATPVAVLAKYTTGTDGSVITQSDTHMSRHTHMTEDEISTC